MSNPGIPIPSLARVAEVCPPDSEAGPELAANPNRVEYYPLPKQQQFHELPETEKLSLGGIGSGKSAAGAMEALYHVALYNRGTPHIGVMGAPTYPMLRDSVVPAVRQWFPPAILAGGSWDAAFSRSAMALRIYDGSMILFRSLGEDNYERMRNLEIAWAGVEEASLLRDNRAWQVLLGRLRARVRKLTLWGITSPRGENWIAQDFVLNPKPGTAYVRSKTSDNFHLPPGYLERLRAAYSERHARQELDGEIVTPEGSVYAELEKKLWPEGNAYLASLDPFRPVVLLVDFGPRRPSVLAVQRIQARHPVTGRDYQLDVIVWELQGPNERPPEDIVVDQWVATVKALKIQVQVIHGDPAGDSRNDQTHETSARIVRDRLGAPFVPPTQAWQRSKERGEETVAGRIKAADGSRYLVWACSSETDRLGQPKLLAPNSFASLQALQYPERKAGQPAATESLKDGIHDHDADAIR